MSHEKYEYVKKDVPKYIPSVAEIKNTWYSKWFNKNVVKYLPYHCNIKKNKHFIKRNVAIISSLIVLIVLFLSLVIFSDEESGIETISKSRIYFVSIFTVIEIIALTILLFYSIYTCVFYHKSFSKFVIDFDYSDFKKIKKLPKHSIKYLWQLGYIDKKVYELIVSK